MLYCWRREYLWTGLLPKSWCWCP